MKEYYRAAAVVDLDAIRYNIELARKQIGPGVRLMAVIKADGYGHGAVPVMKMLEDLADAYGVAIPEEALELRRAGTRKEILILGYTPAAYYTAMVQENITLTVFSYDMAKELSDAAQAAGKKACVHIKLDTGMSRIGFLPVRENVAEILKVRELPGIEITGMFTHFACADRRDKSSALAQFERYKEFNRWLEEAGIHIPVKHAANSASIMELPQTHMDMVRSGITTYGLYPSDEMEEAAFPVRPALSLTARIVHVKEVPAQMGIGYGSTFVTERPARIATIPVGYADGYSRQLSNKGRVLIHGKSCPITGRICMDQFMVDVTEAGEVKAGDLAVLLGRDGDEVISAEEIGALTGSFNYEVVCSISKRVPRVYISGGKKVGTYDHYGCYPGDFELEF